MAKKQNTGTRIKVTSKIKAKIRKALKKSKNKKSNYYMHTPYIEELNKRKYITVLDDIWLDYFND